MSSAQQHYEEGVLQYCKSQANKTAFWYPEAARTFTKAIEADADFIKAYEMRAKCYDALKEGEKAAKDRAAIDRLNAARVQERKPDRRLAKSHYSRGLSSMEPGGLIETALYCFFMSIDADPDFADPYKARSEVYSVLGMGDEAIADLKVWGKLASHARGPSTQQPQAPERPARSPEPNVLHLRCAGCGHLLAIPRKYCGTAGKCRYCHHRFTVPFPAENDAAPSDSGMDAPKGDVKPPASIPNEVKGAEATAEYGTPVAESPQAAKPVCCAACGNPQLDPSATGWSQTILDVCKCCGRPICCSCRKTVREANHLWRQCPLCKGKLL